MIDGVRVPRDVSYQVEEGLGYSFHVVGHDPGRELVIDPLWRATFLGGYENDDIFALIVHPVTGEIYVAGSTRSNDLPGIDLESPDQERGLREAFVARLNPDLTVLYQATFLGGRSYDRPYALAVDPRTGDVYVAGETTSVDFPGVPTSSANTRLKGFVTWFNGALTELRRSTYLGGDAESAIGALSIHPLNGDVYVAGYVSGGLPSIDDQSADRAISEIEGFVSRLDNGLTSICRSTYIGGESADWVMDLAIHPETGDVYVAGYTYSRNFPGIGSNSPDTTVIDHDCFVSHLKNDLTRVYQSTYLGGEHADKCTGLAINPQEESLYVLGETSSRDFPGIDLQSADFWFEGDSEGFVTKMNTALTSIGHSSYLGGDARDLPYDVVVDQATWDVFVCGKTYSSNFPGILNTSPDRVFEGDTEALSSRLDPKLEVFYQSTYLGGVRDEDGFALAIHPNNHDVYVAGCTGSGDFPGVDEDSADRVVGLGEGFICRWAAGIERVSVLCGDFHSDNGKEIAVAA